VNRSGALDFLVIGHVTRDLVGKGSVPGGAAFYTSLTAACLGRRAALVTRGAPHEAMAALEGAVQVVNLPSETTTVFENTYLGGRRSQVIHSVAPPIGDEDVPDEWRGCAVRLLATVYRDVEGGLLPGHHEGLVGLCPQGWMREKLADGRVKPVVWDGGDVLRHSHLMVLSQEDLPGKSLPKGWSQWPGILVITQGEQGAAGRWDGQWHRIPAYMAREMNPTGAGDVFAAAFLVRYSETKDAAESALFASAAASIKVEYEGIGGIPTRRQVQERRAKHRDLRVMPCERPF
jgi:1D-myo-inositol 3-kinase